MLIYDYNSDLHKYKEVHDETGGRLGELTFKHYDCVCGCADYNIVATTTRHRNHFTIVQCKKCGTLRLNPYMTDEAITTYYKDIYGPIKRKGMTAESLFERQSRSADKLFKALSPLIKKDAAILDYGSGAGGRMTRFKTEGYDVSLFDYDQKYLDFGVSQGFKAHSSGSRYDMITLSHVLEHVNQPVEFLHELVRDYLKPGGSIYIEVPVFDKYVRLWDFHLAHKFYFTQQSLSLLPAMAGFKKLHEAEGMVVVTPSLERTSVTEPEYKQALAASNALLKNAVRQSRAFKRKRVIKNIFKVGV